ncbi:hypothetical protein [Phycicoccus flavus]|uniref:hypothetical protein n=1 Tax=Phycicoccus flavus TaxID=2502783 RepID=UPI00197CA2F2|nr:hypothetical protein [Phycicoccus flavus]
MALLTTLALAACSGDDGGDAATATPSAGAASGAPSGTTGGTTSPSASAAPSVVPSSAETAGVDPANPPDPIASVTIPAVSPDETDPKATLEVDLLSLRREGRIVVATFAFTPTSTDTKDGWLYDWLGGQSWQPYLVDTTNLRRHDVLRSSDGRYYRSNYQGSRFASGQTWYAYAGFAAPPDGVSTLDVAAVDGAPAFRGVTIS